MTMEPIHYGTETDITMMVNSNCVSACLSWTNRPTQCSCSLRRV